MNRKQIALLGIGLSMGVVLFALYHFGIVYAHSEGLDAEFRADYPAARTYWTISANLGYTPSKTILGTMYLFGKGIPADPVLAHKYLLSAAEDGDVDAETIYGMASYAGKTLPIDKEAGLLWIRKAAAGGDETAHRFLSGIVNQ